MQTLPYFETEDATEWSAIRQYGGTYHVVGSADCHMPFLAEYCTDLGLWLRLSTPPYRVLRPGEEEGFGTLTLLSPNLVGAAAVALAKKKPAFRHALLSALMEEVVDEPREQTPSLWQRLVRWTRRADEFVFGKP